MSGETRNVSARDWLKANKPRLRWYPWEGLNNRKYQAVDPSFKHPDWVVAAVYTMGTEGVWHIEDVRDVSLQHFYHFVSDDAAGVMAKAEELWFNRANLAEAEEGSARAFLKSVGRPLRWEDTGRISRGYDDTWTKDPGAPVAKVSMKDYGVWTLSYVRGWIVSLQRYPSKKDAQQRAERLWFQVRHTPGVVEAKEGSARDFFKSHGQLTLQPANEGRDIIADSPWGRAYVYRRGDVASLMGHEVSDPERFLPRLVKALKEAGFAKFSFRITDSTDGWVRLLDRLGIRSNVSHFSHLVYAEVPL